MSASKRAFMNADSKSFPQSPPCRRVVGGKKILFRSCENWRDASRYPGPRATIHLLAEEFHRRYDGRRPDAFFGVNRKIEPDKDSETVLMEYPAVIMAGECQETFEIVRSDNGERILYLMFNLARELGAQLKRAKKILETQQSVRYPKAVRVQSSAKLVTYLRLLDADLSRELKHAARFFFPENNETQQMNSARECVKAAKLICTSGALRPRTLRSEFNAQR